jgi:hypothetical protein
VRSLVLVAVLGGCGGSAPAHHIPDEYTGCGGDEQFRLFDDSEPTATIDDTRAPQLTQPTGSSFPYSPKPVLQWNQDPNDPGENDGDVLYLDGTGGCNMCCPQFNTGALTSLHLPPISGDMYDLQFYVGGNYVHRVVTTLQEWTAPDELWLSWKGKTVDLKLYRASVLINQIKEGPFVASHPMVFNVGS